jgi:hypothetical protein
MQRSREERGTRGGFSKYSGCIRRHTCCARSALGRKDISAKQIEPHRAPILKLIKSTQNDSAILVEDKEVEKAPGRTTRGLHAFPSLRNGEAKKEKEKKEKIPM